MRETAFRDMRYRGEVSVEMVPPSSLDDSLGILDGVDLTASKLSCAYYSDTRTSGTLRVVGDGWVRGSFLRVVYRVPELSHERELGTYIVTNDDSTRVNGTWVYDLELKSVLHGLSTDIRPANWTIKKNSYAKAAFRQLFEAAGRDYDMGAAKDYRFKYNNVLKGGKTRLERLFWLCDSSGNRLDVDGHGRVTVAKYVSPSARAWSYQICPGSKRGMAADGIERSTNWLEMRTEASVRFTYSTGSGSKEKVITATSKATVGHNTRAARGYVVSDYHELTEMEPRTAARATELARKYREESGRELVEWRLSMPYLPIWQGDVVNMVVPDGLDEYRGTRKCLVKSLDLELSTMGMDVTLKETASGDEEE